MKKIIYTTIITCLSLSCYSQYKPSKFQNFSLEASYGFNAATTPKNIDNSSNKSFNTFQIGVGYKLNDFWGLMGTYTNSTFKNEVNSNLGITYHKIMIEGNYNIIAAANSSNSTTNSSFDVNAHGGFGVTFGSSKSADKVDQIGNFQIGLKPTYKIDDMISVFVDGTYVMNFRQHLDYNGLSLGDNKMTTGGFYTALIGLAVSLDN